jgi:predicted dithiol-disulfide oxidoreductase (DUF899 family)
MTKHKTGPREESLEARLALLDAEKEHARRGDELAQRRQELPWVPIEKKCRFETKEAPRWRTFFRGRSQLLVYTSCSRPIAQQAGPPARRSRTGSTALSSIWPTMTSCFGL